MRTLTLLLLIGLFACKEKFVHPTQGEIVEAVYGLGTVESDEVYNARSGLQVTVREFYVVEGQDVKKDQKLFALDQGVVFSSPFSGRVTSIPTHVRENISPQALILSVVNLEKLYLSVALEQQAAMKIRRGLSTEISFVFFRNRKIQGVIDSFYPKDNEFIAKVKFLKIPDGILPGMTADVAFEVARKKDAILVPASTVSNGHLVLIKNKKRVRIEVELGLADLEKVEILSPKIALDDEIALP